MPEACSQCLIILQDEHTFTRLAAAARYERIKCGFRLGPDHGGAPSAYRRARLAQLLTIHDALNGGASTRELPFSLVFGRDRPLAGATWKGSDERRHTLRLIAEARRLVNGGYRNLLHHE